MQSACTRKQGNSGEDRGMLNAITFLTSRTGILLVSLLSISAVLSWGLMQKLQKVELEKQIARNEAAYQLHVTEALEKQREAINQATLAERRRLKDIETKWNKLKASLKNEKDYTNSAPVSVVHALNRLSEPTGDRPEILPARTGIPVNQ
jgi:ABC-type transport system involved in cytochrome bd biosynthesis fused ATPase/permease subunit